MSCASTCPNGQAANGKKGTDRNAYCSGGICFQQGVEPGIIAQRVVGRVHFDGVDVGSVLGAGLFEPAKASPFLPKPMLNKTKLVGLSRN